jgi:hypothetical protein
VARRQRVFALGDSHIVKVYLACLCLALVLGCSSTPPPRAGRICVSVRGQVKHPGKYSLPEGVRLPDALHSAGGFTDFAFLKRIEIHHQDGAVEYCNFRKTGGDVVLVDGDQIVVRSNGWEGAKVVR